MPTEILGANLGHQRRTGAASGVAGTTTAAFTPFIKGTEHINLEPRNFASSAAIIKFAFCPYLVILKADSSNDLADPPIDYSDVAQDGSTGTSVNLSGLAAGRNVYIGSAVPFRGAHIDVDATNSTGSTDLTAYYWNGSAWVDLSDTDGTSSSVSLDQDGAVTWTVPSAWVSKSLVDITNIAGGSVSTELTKWRDVAMYWTKWTWDAAMDSTVTLDHVLGINESVAYSELTSSTAFEGRIHHGFGTNGVSGIELLTDTGTANVLIACSAMNGYFSEGAIS